MKENARRQEAIEILDTYLPSHGPLAPFIKRHLKERRYAGSSDRRAITDLVFSLIRQAPMLLWTLEKQQWEPGLGRALMMTSLVTSPQTPVPPSLAEIFTGLPHEPQALSDGEKTLCDKLLGETTLSTTAQPPEAISCGLFPWLFDAFLVTGDLDPQDLLAFNGTAPLDMRCSTPPEDVQKELAKDGIETIPTPYSPLGLRVTGTPGALNIQNHPLYQRGIIDVQDESSQILACLCRPTKDMRILDLCAGAGGKSLALATLCPTAQITATDIDLKRLKIGFDRAQLQNIENIEFVDYKAFLRNAGNIENYDLVLVDAPCSGTGTFRRHPELKLALTPQKITAFQSVQRELLQTAQRFVVLGGRLVYATCSLLPSENEAVAKDFITQHPFFSLVKASNLCDRVLNKNPLLMGEDYLKLGPARHETDGFFAAFFDRLPEGLVP